MLWNYAASSSNIRIFPIHSHLHITYLMDSNQKICITECKCCHSQFHHVLLFKRWQPGRFCYHHTVLADWYVKDLSDYKWLSESFFISSAILSQRKIVWVIAVNITVQQIESVLQKKTMDVLYIGILTISVMYVFSCRTLNTLKRTCLVTLL